MLKKGFASIAIIAIIAIITTTGIGSYVYIKNRQLKPIGGETNSHGCLIAAGYSWCEPKQKCLRIWEEPCTETTTVSTTVVDTTTTTIKSKIITTPAAALSTTTTILNNITTTSTTISSNTTTTTQSPTTTMISPTATTTTILSTITTTKPKNLYIGQYYGGGKIAYIFQYKDSGYDFYEKHGLIVAPTNQSNGIQWYNGVYIITGYIGTSTIGTGAIGTEIGTGLANTNTIVAKQGIGTYAAKLCNDLVLDGYDDWYLPSKDELYQIFLNNSYIGGFISETSYWSSSESGVQKAWALKFQDGTWQEYDKYFANAVRCVRSF